MPLRRAQDARRLRRPAGQRVEALGRLLRALRRALPRRASHQTSGKAQRRAIDRDEVAGPSGLFGVQRIVRRRKRGALSACPAEALHAAHALHHLHHAAALHLLHHVAHLLELVQQAVDLLNLHAGAARDAALARGLQQLGLPALERRHRADDAFHAAHVALGAVHVGRAELGGRARSAARVACPRARPGRPSSSSVKSATGSRSGRSCRRP